MKRKKLFFQKPIYLIITTVLYTCICIISLHFNFLQASITILTSVLLLFLGSTKERKKQFLLLIPLLTLYLFLSTISILLPFISVSGFIFISILAFIIDDIYALIVAHFLIGTAFICELLFLSPTPTNHQFIFILITTILLTTLIGIIYQKVQYDNELISYLAYYDALTDIPNRLSFYEHLKTCDTTLPLALCFIDLDGFKKVNDTLGHQQGDILLKEVGIRLKLFVNPSIFVARLAGDEFVIVIQNHSTDDVFATCQNLFKMINEGYSLENQIVRISCSIGISQLHHDANTIDEMLTHSDTAMYKAKKDKINKIHFYTDN